MRPVFKSKVIMTLSVIFAFFSNVCAHAAEISENHIFGDWIQAETIMIEQGGMSVILRDTMISYDRDGTSSGSLIMVLEGLPKDLASYKISTTREWRIEDGFLIDSPSETTVESLYNTTRANILAAHIETGLEAQSEVKNEIKALTVSSLILFSGKSGMTFEFVR